MRRAAIRQAIRESGRDVTFDEDPQLEIGERIVLLHSKAKGPIRWAIVESVTPPRPPSWWVRNPPKPVWTVRVSRHEVETPRFLRSGPLPYVDHERLREDCVRPPTPEEIERAGNESSYRTSGDPLGAGECVGPEWLERFGAEAQGQAFARRREAIERR